MSPRRRLWWVAPFVVAGIAVLVLLVLTRVEPEHEAAAEAARPVSVIAAPAVDLLPRVLAYGVVRPGQVWRGVAEVGGRVVAVHPQLDAGVILPAATRLLEIDPTDYQLAVAEIEAAIEGREARLAELDVRARNAGRSLEIERRNLELARRELARKLELAEAGSIARSAADQELRQTLQQERAVQNLDNELALVPSERRRLEAELARDRSRLAQARRDLERTTIRAPFDLRVAAVDLEVGQFVSPGQVVVQADGIAVAEVPAQVSVERFRSLLSAVGMPEGVNPGAIEAFLQQQGLEATVRLGSEGRGPAWEARVDRVGEALDPQTRTLSVVVAVDAPYARARPPEKPPLVRNMYVAVELRARPRPGTVVIPRVSVNDGRAYVVGADNRLEIRPVEIAFRQGDLLAVSAGVEAGEQVVVAELVPAIAGMLLEPVADAAAREQLLRQARGEAPPP